MLKELFIALFYAGLPFFIASCLMLYWARAKGYRVRYQNEKKSAIKNEQKPRQLSAEGVIMNRWLAFGGGYYGMMAFVTYVHVEVSDIYAAFSRFESFAQLIDALSVSFLIGLIVEAIKNLITAFLWFTYWDDVYTISYGWIWLAVTYASFLLAEEVVPPAGSDLDSTLDAN